LSASGEKNAQMKHCLQLKMDQNRSKQDVGGFCCKSTTGDGLFHWGKHYYGLWIHFWPDATV